MGAAAGCRSGQRRSRRGGTDIRGASRAPARITGERGNAGGRDTVHGPEVHGGSRSRRGARAGGPQWLVLALPQPGPPASGAAGAYASARRPHPGQRSGEQQSGPALGPSGTQDRLGAVCPTGGGSGRQRAACVGCHAPNWPHPSGAGRSSDFSGANKGVGGEMQVPHASAPSGTRLGLRRLRSSLGPRRGAGGRQRMPKMRLQRGNARLVPRMPGL